MAAATVQGAGRESVGLVTTWVEEVWGMMDWRMKHGSQENLMEGEEGHHCLETEDPGVG